MRIIAQFDAHLSSHPFEHISFLTIEFFVFVIDRLKQKGTSVNFRYEDTNRFQLAWIMNSDAFCFCSLA